MTQTDFFSFTSGKIYNRLGVQTETLTTGFSPEVIDILPHNLYEAISEIKIFSDGLQKIIESHVPTASIST